MSDKNIFQMVLDGDIPSTKIYEDDVVLAFLDINPVNIGHTLIIPKEASHNIFDTPDETLGHMMSIAKMIAYAQKESLGTDGVNIHMNNEAPAGQEIFHTHIHVIPRYDGDGFTHWKGARGYNDGEAQEVANKIKSNL